MDLIDVWSPSGEEEEEDKPLCQRCLVRPLPLHTHLVIQTGRDKSLRCCGICYRAHSRCSRCQRRAPLKKSPPDAAEAYWCTDCHAAWRYWYRMSASAFAVAT